MSARSGVQISSFGIIKGAMIRETYEIFGRWDPEQSAKVNLDHLIAENWIGSASSSWLKDVAQTISSRFEPARRDLALVQLARRQCPLEVWTAILLWHLSRGEVLVRDFLVHWLYPRFVEGTYSVRTDDVLPYIDQVISEPGRVTKPWSAHTRARVASGLLRLATDFGLLEGTTSRRFASYHLADESFLYLAHAQQERQGNPRRMIEDEDWNMFLMSAGDVERELLRLHQYRKLQYEVAGSIAELKLPCSSAAEYAREMAV